MLYNLEIMSFFARHKRLAGGIAAALFLLANSGFTTVVHYCTMKTSSSAACCLPSDDANNSPMGKTGHSTEMAINAPKSECHTTSVVGGLSDRLAIAEKANSPHLAKTNSVLIPLSFQFAHTPGAYPSRICIYLLDATPPSVEKCILYSSFRI
jgi:hypothetical protein